MADPGTHSSDISPMSHSPRSRSPLRRPMIQQDASQPRFASPLRIEESADSTPSSSIKLVNGSAAQREGSRDLKPPRLDTGMRTPSGTSSHHHIGASSEPSLARPKGAIQPQDELSELVSTALANSQSSKKPANDGTVTPTGRRSVQFARSATFEGQSTQPLQGHSRQQSFEDGGEGHVKDKQGSSLLARIKALSPISLQTHGRSLSGFSLGESPLDGTGRSAASESKQRYFPEESEDDADGEDSGAEGSSKAPAKQKRRSRKYQFTTSQTAPTTPKNEKGPSMFRDSPGATPISEVGQRPMLFPRRLTVSDSGDRHRAGVSEDEGRARMAKDSAWRRGLNGARGSSFARQHTQDEEGDPEPRRPMNLRRITGFGGTNADGSPMTTGRRIRGFGERSSSMGAQKWRQIKAGLKMLGRQKKDEARTADHTKSAELVAELLAGSPAAMLLALSFQRDEHGHKRIPVLLEQLKVRIVDSQRTENKAGDRHLLFRIELEYGSGLTRMKWIIHRTLRDFANLHVKYKLQTKSERYIQLKSDDNQKVKFPRFPRSALPYLRGVRGLVDDGEEDEDDDAAGDQANDHLQEPNPGYTSGFDGEASATDRPTQKHRHPTFSLGRRKSSIGGHSTTGGILGELTARTGSFMGAMGQSNASVRPKDAYAEKQRKKLERYLSQLIGYLMLRADANRLCKFLELSALGIRLSSEGGYHGKEGLLMIRSGKGEDFRKRLTPKLVVNRHTPKWFLIRHSYIACVESPENMNVYDVILVDSDFAINTKKRLRDQSVRDVAKSPGNSTPHPNHHQLKITNSERTIKLVAKNERQLNQWEESINFMKSQTLWAQEHRFQSFAPVRHKVFAQWLVDGRDYMWNVSRAISLAKDVIYIHDWWLSPELYLRRPAAISQKWRLDRLLQQKAQEGVKIFIIMYRNVNAAIPIDSGYSKFSLLNLHPNIFVQRSPNQLRQNTFLWAHHEKVCVVDHAIAFCGGIDLCFGRWDTAEHRVTDDKPTGFELNDTPKDSDHIQLWPGKDYSNPRIQDFFKLDDPYEEMYDRTQTPRMPWHDIGMQMVGQPARDLVRHFVQRWNYLLRQRKPSRPTPFLVPPVDFNPADIEALGLDGTCEIQILRSASSWSMGTPDKVEHSILNAYVTMIQRSDHFVYIENQFFISSSHWEKVKFSNPIGDALVERIKRAHAEDEVWRAIIVIPLMPGFQNTVDQQEGSSVRLIMAAQYKSICRGESSIFGRLRAVGIDPEEYIEFYSLRSWGKIGPKKVLVTEQLYIHAKCMIVDDRVAIIGSANINERSMLGNRDSEIAAIVRDTDLVDSFMAGEPYKVGRFPHTLRMRLMREHLGIDVDALEGDHESGGLSDDDDHYSDYSKSSRVSDRLHEVQQMLVDQRYRVQDELIAKADTVPTFNHDADIMQASNPNVIAPGKKLTTDSRVIGNEPHEKDVRGEGVDNMMNHPDIAGRDTVLDGHGNEILIHDISPEGKGTLESPKKQVKTRARSNTNRTRRSSVSVQGKGNEALPPPKLPRLSTQELGLTQLSQLPALPMLDDTDIGGPPLQRSFSAASLPILRPLLAELRRPVVNPDCMLDPLNDAFYYDTWHTVAENNTKIFRQVFRCQPDNEVKTWKEYKEYNAYAERFIRMQGGEKSETRQEQESTGRSGPPGANTSVQDKVAHAFGDVGDKIETAGEKVALKMSNKDTPGHHNLGKVEDWAAEQEHRIQAEGSRATRQISKDSATTAEDFDEKTGLYGNDAQRQVSRESTTPFPIVQTGLGDDSRSSTATPPATASARGRNITINEPNRPNGVGSQRGRRRRATTKSSLRALNSGDDSCLLAKSDAEGLLNMVQGHLITWPYDWLEKEEKNGGWHYTVDMLAPLDHLVSPFVSNT